MIINVAPNMDLCSAEIHITIQSKCAPLIRELGLISCCWWPHRDYRGTVLVWYVQHSANSCISTETGSPCFSDQAWADLNTVLFGWSAENRRIRTSDTCSSYAVSLSSHCVEKSAMIQTRLPCTTCQFGHIQKYILHQVLIWNTV